MRISVLLCGGTVGFIFLLSGCRTSHEPDAARDERRRALDRSLESLEANRIMLDHAIVRARGANDRSASRLLEAAYLCVSDASGTVDWLGQIMDNQAADSPEVDQRRFAATNQYINTQPSSSYSASTFAIQMVQEAPGLPPDTTNVFAILSLPRDPSPGVVKVVLHNNSHETLNISRGRFACGMCNLVVTDVVGRRPAGVPDDCSFVGNLNDVPESMREQFERISRADQVIVRPNSSQDFNVRLGGFWLDEGTYYIRTKAFASNTLVVRLKRRSQSARRD